VKVRGERGKKEENHGKHEGKDKERDGREGREGGRNGGIQPEREELKWRQTKVVESIFVTI